MIDESLVDTQLEILWQKSAGNYDEYMVKLTEHSEGISPNARVVNRSRRQRISCAHKNFSYQDVSAITASTYEAAYGSPLGEAKVHLEGYGIIYGEFYS